MARIDNLNNFLTDVAESIRTKKGTTDLISPSNFDTEIESIESGGDISEYFTETISSGNGSTSGWENTIKKMPTFTNTGTSCAYMFASFPLNEIDLSKINTSEVTTMEYMFYNCKKINSLDLSTLNTAKVTKMNYMISGCSLLSSINLNNFNTSNVTTMDYMFGSCSNLTEIIGLENFNTSKVSSMQGMFSLCKKLTRIDLRSFDFTKVTKYGNMFNGLTDCLIIVKDDTDKEWITSKFTTLTNVKTVAELEA